MDFSPIFCPRLYVERFFLISTIWKKSPSSVGHTAKSTVISPYFLVWKFCGKARFPHRFRASRPKLCRDCAFPQNFHTKKSGEITVFFAVSASAQPVIWKQIPYISLGFFSDFLTVVFKNFGSFCY